VKDSPPTSPPSETAKAEQVLVLPGHLFFIERIEIPVALEAAEMTDFAELSLESIAPFPIEQLNWGYLYDQDAAALLLYATHRDRLKNTGYSDLHAYAWVLPDFATLAGACFPEGTQVVLDSSDHLALLQFEKGIRIPQTVHAAPLIEGNTATALEAALRSTMPDQATPTKTLQIRPAVIELSEQGMPTFQFEAAETTTDAQEYGAWQSLSPTEKALWQADVRSAEFKSNERNARRTSALLGRITGWAAIFALLLLGAELLLLGSEAWLGTLERQIESQRTTVLTIEDKQTLMNKLEQVAQNELRPVAILEAANNIRLDFKLGIEYDSTVIDNENRITIEGKASSINALNRYTESLRQSGQFELVTQPESITRAGKTTFTITLAYTHTEPDNVPTKDTSAANNTEEAEI
jgi:hypothetical protein